MKFRHLRTTNRWMEIICLATVMICVATTVQAKGLITRRSRIKTVNNQIVAVGPAYQWVLDEVDLPKMISVS